MAASKSSTPPPHAPLARLADGYWAQSRQPLAALVFIAPLLVTYETGLLVLGRYSVQNGADAWLRALLNFLGFSQYFLLPILIVCILLGWHYTTRQSWQLSRGLLWAMAGECLAMAICLRLLVELQRLASQAAAEALRMELSSTIREGVGRAIGFLGAGIYEELLFRLIMLSLLAWGLKRLGVAGGKRMVIAVLLTSLLFSAAHYVGPYGEALEGFSFLFRFLAGIFFSVLFVYRGFGIAAGTHAGYNILAGLF